MESELTGRKVKITRQLREMADEGLARIEKIVGRGASAHVIFSAQRHVQMAEVTVTARQHTVVGLAEAPDLTIALRTALDKVEKQALRRKKRIVEKKRQAKPLSESLPVLVVEERRPPVADRRTKKSVAKNGTLAGLHIVPAPEALALRAMTLEEAVKEVESRDREVFVFRDLAGNVKVLHCTGDGFVRLIEVP